MKCWLNCLLAVVCLGTASVHGVITGGRPNSFSGGNNAFAGVVNPANAVWIPDRFDLEGVWVHQKSSISNNGNPFFPSGKTDLTYQCKNLLTANFAINKHGQLNVGANAYDASFSLAAYTLPTYSRSRTKAAIRALGTTRLYLFNRTDVLSAVFSIKLNDSHSIGCAVDYVYLSHIRNGFQNSDNSLRSVSPGNVTNRGKDHSSGVGFSVGWRWIITKKLAFGIAWAKKSYCGQFRRYRGYEPRHADNFIPQTVGGGFSYQLTPQLAGRLELLWSNQGNTPGANNNLLSNGRPNTNKRGSRKSPGPGLQDSTYINLGLGYKVNSMLSLGSGYSHRIKLFSPYFLSHSYRRQTIYDTLSFGANFKYHIHDLFLVFSYGFKNRLSGTVPATAGGGKFASERQTTTLLISWGTLF